MKIIQTRVRIKGFTMLELMIAVMAMGLTLLTVILGNTYLQQVNEKSYERMIAAQDAQRLIELVRNVSMTGNFPQNVVGAYPQGAAVPGFNNLPSEQISVSYVNPTVDPLDMTVTTNWRERGRRNASFQLRTFMTQRTNP